MKIQKSIAVRPFPIAVAVLTLLLLLIVVPISFAYPTIHTDYGDLPDVYDTLASSNGAAHDVGGPYMGSCVDSERNGLPSGAAIGDDDDFGSGGSEIGICENNDDEDGVSFVGDWSDGTGDINVTVNGEDACLNVWLDWGDGTAALPTGDGDFDAGDHVLVNEAVSVGDNQPFSFSLPTGAADRATWYLRARLTPLGGNDMCSDAAAYGGTASPSGHVSGGEVEDYRIPFSPTAVTLQNAQANITTPSATLIAGLVGFLVLALVSLRIVFSRRT